MEESIERLHREIAKWTDHLRAYPGFRKWKAKTLVATLDYGDPYFGRAEPPPAEFPFPPRVQSQHAAVMAYLSMLTSWHAVADTEFYFRRYPFRGLPVSRDTHLRYVCEMYFSRIYEFSERLKKCLNAINEVALNHADVGAVVKVFARDFKQELKERNLIHHNTRFDDIFIDKVALTGMMALADQKSGDRGWKREHNSAYRKASKEWADRARIRSGDMERYTSAVADFMLRECIFLREPVGG